MHKNDENQDNITGVEKLSRQVIPKPRILARRVWKRSSNTPDRIESTPLDPKPCSTEKEEFEEIRNEEIDDTEGTFNCAELGDMHKDDENRHASSAEEPSRRMIRRPRILAQRTWKKLSNTISSIETMDLDPKPCSIEKKESGNVEMDQASNTEGNRQSNLFQYLA
ncbi:hypothetical protein QQG55_0160 [Brugia pahangi]